MRGPIAHSNGGGTETLTSGLGAHEGRHDVLHIFVVYAVSKLGDACPCCWRTRRRRRTLKRFILHDRAGSGTYDADVSRMLVPNNGARGGIASGKGVVPAVLDFHCDISVDTAHEFRET